MAGALDVRRQDRAARFLLRLFLSVVLLAALVTGCGHNSKPAFPPPSAVGPTDSSGGDRSGIKFDDIAKRAGLNYVYPKQPRPMRNLEAFGCGCAAFDYDNDGWVDILLVSKPHPILYHNRGDGTFEDVTAASRLDKLSGDWKGVGIGDYDGDGRLDIALTGFRRLCLLRNVGGKRFDDATVAAGLSPSNRNHWGSSAGFMDLDGSGNLALVILNYVVFNAKEPQYCELTPGVKSGCPPGMYKPEFAELWRNNGRGRFTEVSKEAGFAATHGKALVMGFADVDDDGKIDIYMGNDGTPADLMRNLGGLRFKNVGEESGTAGGITGKPFAAMGADWADYNGDGRLDLAVSAFSNEVYALYENRGNGVFAHAEEQTGIAGRTLNPLGFGTTWLDFDNDGWPDLAFANGHVYDNVEHIDAASTYRQPLLLFENQAGKQFIDITPDMPPEVGRPLVGRGSAVADFDNDGREDLLVVDYEGAPVLLHNVSNTKNHWVTVDLRMEGSNRFAYGAVVTARSGARKWISTVSAARSYLSSSDPRIHFGCGSATKLDEVSIRWPDSKRQNYQNVSCDRSYRIQRGHPIELSR
jgi:hypothetical protein